MLPPAFKALMKKAPTASFDGLGKATCTAPAGTLSKVNNYVQDQILVWIYLPWLLFCDPKIRRFPLLLAKANVIIMATDKLVSERLETR